MVSAGIRPGVSHLNTAVLREDPLVELAVLERLGRPLRVLAVASSGCTALSLLTSPYATAIDAVDPNPAQLHLVALKREALVRLSRDDQLRLLGAREGSEPGRLYQDLRDFLPPDTRAHWDARPAEIAAGLVRAGKQEALLRELAEAFERRGLDPVGRPAEALTDKAWPAIFEEAFGRAKLAAALGPEAVAFSPDSLAEHYARTYAQAMLRYAPQDNYFLHLAFLGTYPLDEEALPPYLQREGQGAILRNGPRRLNLQLGRLEDKLDRPYDLILASSVGDRMPRDTLRQLIAHAAASLTPGGALVMRRLAGDYDLGAELADELAYDEAFSQQLRERDRSFSHREIGVAFRT